MVKIFFVGKEQLIQILAQQKSETEKPRWIIPGFDTNRIVDVIRHPAGMFLFEIQMDDGTTRLARYDEEQVRENPDYPNAFFSRTEN